MIPNLDNLIKAFECENWRPNVCKQCEYGYLDESGDNPSWGCDSIRMHEEVLFYLKLYQYLIKENQNA